MARAEIGRAGAEGAATRLDPSRLSSSPVGVPRRAGRRLTGPVAASEKIPPAPHVAADRRRQNHSHNDGSGDPDEPLLAFHPGFHGFALPRRPHPAAGARHGDHPHRPGCGRGGSAGGRGGLGYGGGFGLVGIPLPSGTARSENPTMTWPVTPRAHPTPPRSPVSYYQAHHERTLGQYSTTRGQAMPQIRTTVGTAIKIVRAVMTQVSQRVVTVCRSVAF